MILYRARGRVLISLLILLAFLPAPLRALESCASGSQASYERAVLQAQGERFDATACTGSCQEDVAAAGAAFERATLQAQGERMFDPADLDAMASYQRANIQAQGQVMVSLVQATCDASLA